MSEGERGRESIVAPFTCNKPVRLNRFSSETTDHLQSNMNLQDGALKSEQQNFFDSLGLFFHGHCRHSFPYNYGMIVQAC